MEIEDNYGPSAEELELLKLVDLQKLIEEEALPLTPKPTEAPRLADRLFSHDPSRELRHELAAEKHERIRLFDELDRVKKLLSAKTNELEDQQKRIGVLAKEAELARNELKEREVGFTQKLKELEQSHIKSIQDERVQLDREIEKEKLAADEILAREAVFRAQVEFERKEYEGRIALVNGELEAVRKEIAIREKRSEDLQKEFERAEAVVKEKSVTVQMMEARLKVLEAERNLLSTDLEQRKKIYEADLMGKEKALREDFASQQKALAERLEAEKIELGAKLLREKAVRENLEKQKQSYSERMIELAWELKEKQRTQARGSIISPDTQKTLDAIFPLTKPDVMSLSEPLSKEKEQTPNSVETAPDTGMSLQTKANVEDSVPQVIEIPLSLKIPQAEEASELRRMAAGAVDILFVATLWVIGVVLTANVLNGFTSGFSPKVLDELSNPAFLRAILMEYGICWFFYFSVCVGVLDRTCGMWVWELRVEYTGSVWAKLVFRSIRVIASTVLFSLGVPLVLLSIRVKRRNLIDYLSQSRLVLHASDFLTTSSATI